MGEVLYSISYSNGGHCIVLSFLEFLWDIAVTVNVAVFAHVMLLSFLTFLKYLIHYKVLRYLIHYKLSVQEVLGHGDSLF